MESTKELDVGEIKREAMTLAANHVRGQHSNNKVIRLCIEVERLRALLADAPDSMEALRVIALIGGNLPDSRLTDKTGANDAAYRGIMYCSAREIARAVIEKAESR